MTLSRVGSGKPNEFEKGVIRRKKKKERKSLGEWKSTRSFKINEMTAHIWSFKPEHRTRVRGTHISEQQWEREGQWRNDGKKEQSSYLGRPSSGVPDLKGKQEHSQQRTRDHGKLCDTDTQASLTEQMSVLLEGCGDREEWDGEKEEGAQTGLAWWAFSQPKQVAMHHQPLTSHHSEI